MKVDRISFILCLLVAVCADTLVNFEGCPTKIDKLLLDFCFVCCHSVPTD